CATTVPDRLDDLFHLKGCYYNRLDRFAEDELNIAHCLMVIGIHHREGYIFFINYNRQHFVFLDVVKWQDINSRRFYVEFVKINGWNAKSIVEESQQALQRQITHPHKERPDVASNLRLNLQRLHQVFRAYSSRFNQNFTNSCFARRLLRNIHGNAPFSILSHINKQVIFSSDSE